MATKKPKTATQIINESAKNKAPAFNKGLQGIDVKEFLANSDANDIRAVMARDFATWAAFSGIKVDGNPLEFESHRYLLPIYMDPGEHIVWMKAAQLGATVFLLLKLLWYCRNSEVRVRDGDGGFTSRGPNVSLYFPTGGGVEALSKGRLNPIISQNEELRSSVTEVDTLTMKQFRNIHDTISTLYMTYMGGTDSKDSTPLDVLAFDEVRLMGAGDIDQVQERFAHSPLKHQIYMSTAGFPGCFAGNTKILVRDKRNGRIYSKNIEDLVEEYTNYQVLSYNRVGGSRTRWRDILGAKCQGERDVSRVTFCGGTSVVCTEDHKFLQLNVRPHQVVFDWTEVAKVRRYPKHFGGVVGPSEGVACVTRVQERVQLKPAAAPYDLLTCRVVGFFVAEGCMGSAVEVDIYQSNPKEDLTFIEQWCDLHDLTYRRVTDSPKHNGIFVSVRTRPDLQRLFAECGHRAPNKKIPDSILSGSNSQIQQVLDGIIAGDGHIRKSGGKLYDIFTTSEELHSQLLVIGTRLGKPFTVQRRDPRTSVIAETGQVVKSRYVEIVLSYNPNSFRNKEVLSDLGRLAIRSVTPEGAQLVYDLQIDSTPWFTLAESGALVHNSDISSRFAQGTQLTFHSVCNCSTPVILPETFPDCVVERKKKDGTMETYYRCPKCKYRINDVQNGNYIAHNPSASYNSYSVSQLNSSHIKPADLFAFFKSTTNMKEFYNGKLGMPYVDENARPITDDVFNACIDETLHWQMDLPSHRVSGSCAMGVDQHSGNVYVTLLKRGKEGKKDIVHLEIVDDQNPIYWKYSEKFGRDVPVSPFVRLHEIMTEFNVGMCVIDLMPNANEAMALARAFPGKVFTAIYRDTGQDMVSWADRPTSKQSTKKGSHYIKNKYQVTLNRYLTLDYSLKLWVDGVIAIPPVGKLLPLVKSRKKEDNGRFIATPIALILRDHLKCLVREEQVVDEATGKVKNVFIYLGQDPHSAHATNYACIAIERLRTGAFFIM